MISRPPAPNACHSSTNRGPDQVIYHKSAQSAYYGQRRHESHLQSVTWMEQAEHLKLTTLHAATAMTGNMPPSRPPCCPCRRHSLSAMTAPASVNVSPQTHNTSGNAHYETQTARAGSTPNDKILRETQEKTGAKCPQRREPAAHCSGNESLLSPEETPAIHPSHSPLLCFVAASRRGNSATRRRPVAVACSLPVLLYH